MFKRLLHITHVFQLSRLFHRQWRTNPAVAIASLTINAYKRRVVLSDKMQMSFRPLWVSRICDSWKMRKPTHVLYTITTDTFTHARENLVIHKSLFCRGQTRNFVECDPGHQKNTEVQHLSFDCCAQMWSWWWYNLLLRFSLKTSCSHIAL